MHIVKSGLLFARINTIMIACLLNDPFFPRIGHASLVHAASTFGTLARNDLKKVAESNKELPVEFEPAVV